MKFDGPMGNCNYLIRRVDGLGPKKENGVVGQRVREVLDEEGAEVQLPDGGGRAGKIHPQVRQD